MLTSIFTGCTAPGSASGGKIDIGIVLPTKDESRWLGDEAKFRAIIEERGYKAEIMYSQANSGVEKTNIESLIEKGIKVLVLCAFDATAAASAVEKAKAEGVTVISYDRLIMDTDAVDYYVTFDSVAVGRAMGQYLVDQAKGKGNNLYLYSGALTDNNSFLFFQGQWEALQPKIADGTFIVRNSDKAASYANIKDLTREQMSEILSQIDTEWNMEKCKTLAEAHLTANSAEAKNVCYVLGPDDDTCRALSDTFSADADVKELIITGADGVAASIQYLIDGKQSMTVFKDPGILVKDTMNLVDTILSGKKPEVNASYNNNVIDVPSIQSDVVIVTRDNLKEVFFDTEYYDKSNYTGWENLK